MKPCASSRRSAAAPAACLLLVVVLLLSSRSSTVRAATAAPRSTSSERPQGHIIAEGLRADEEMATAAAEPLASGTEAAASPRAEALGAASPRAAAAAAASASVGGLRAVTRSGRLREKRIGRLPGYVGALHGPPQAGAGAGANAATAAGANGGGVPIVNPPERVAGYFRLNRTHEAEMFYFFYRSRTGRRTDPVVLWMTGGPGCSSEIAILYENGPYTLTKNLTLADNPYGWDTRAHMIFVDQPIGTGYSYSNDPRDWVSTEGGVSADMLDFLNEFFEAHPDIADNDFYVTGESYAGHYAPAVAHRVYRAKELGLGLPINIKGVAIGNGLTMPALQFGAYADFAQQAGLISEKTRDSINWWLPPCRWGARLCNAYKWSWLCGLTLQYCQLAIFQRILMAKPGVNVYDVRKECDGPLCYDFSAADAYLNSKGVRDALGVGRREWSECNMLVHAGFTGDFMRDYGAKLVPLLEDGVRVLIYAGDQDLICNWLGNARWVNALDWEGKEGFAAAPEVPWAAPGAGGRARGSVKAAGGLAFVKVFDAGHMVPMDQPAAALELIARFTRGRPLAGGDGADGGDGDDGSGEGVESKSSGEGGASAPPAAS